MHFYVNLEQRSFTSWWVLPHLLSTLWDQSLTSRRTPLDLSQTLSEPWLGFSLRSPPTTVCCWSGTNQNKQRGFCGVEEGGHVTSAPWIWCEWFERWMLVHLSLFAHQRTSLVKRWHVWKLLFNTVKAQKVKSLVGNFFAVWNREVQQMLVYYFSVSEPSVGSLWPGDWCVLSLLVNVAAAWSSTALVLPLFSRQNRAEPSRGGISVTKQERDIFYGLF